MVTRASNHRPYNTKLKRLGKDGGAVTPKECGRWSQLWSVVAAVVGVRWSLVSRGEVMYSCSSQCCFTILSFKSLIFKL